MGHWSPALVTFCGLLVTLEASIPQSYVLRFTSQPTSIVAAEGQNATVSCTAVSLVGHQITYRWIVNESTWLHPSNKNHFTFNSVTIINLQRRADNGVYRCVASNSVGSILSNKAMVQVAYFDILDKVQSITYKIKLYESIILQAPRVQSVPPARYVWKLKTGDIIEDGYSSGKMFISPNGDLTVVGPKDPYNLTCIVQNPITNQTFQRMYILTIEGEFKKQKDTSFLKTPINQVIDAGLPQVVFECIVDVVLGKKKNQIILLGLPTIRWYKDSDQISVLGSSKYGYLKNTMATTMKLVVYKPDKDDEGEYQCSATWSKTKKSPKARLTVRDPPPKFSTQLPPSITTSSAKRIEIKCPYRNKNEDADEEDEDDTTQCMWYKDALQLVPDGTRILVKDGHLIIRNTKTSDSGFYQVLLRNDGGENIGNATYLTVQGNDLPSIQPSPTKTRSTASTGVVHSIPTSISGKSTRAVFLSEKTVLAYTKPTLPSRTPTHGSITPTLLRPTSPASSAPLSLPSSLSSSSSSSSLLPTTTTATKRFPTSAPLATRPFKTSSFPTTSEPSSPITTKISSPSIAIALPKASTVTQSTTTYNQTAGWYTTERTTEDIDSRKKSVNDGQKGLLMWISAGIGGFVVLSVAIVTVMYCCGKARRPRKQSFKLKHEKYNELELDSLPGRVEGAGKAVEKTSPRNIPGVDTNRLLTDNDESLYAPVTALDNIAADLDNDQSPAEGPVYAEPIKNTKRKPYKKPLPSTPELKQSKYTERPDYIHSYLELLGPDEISGDVYAEPREGEISDLVKNAVKPNDRIYDCAREGVLTNTLRRIMKQGHDEDNINPPLYHVLESQPIENGHVKRESSLYASPEDILPGVSETSSNDRRGYSEPLYHILEPLDNVVKIEDEENMYECYKAEDTIKRDSVYQPLVNYNKDGKSDSDSSNVYQALDLKARSPSSFRGSSHHTADHGKNNRESHSLTDPKRPSTYSGDSEDLYQPLNNSERCPLDVSKPRASFSQLRHPIRDSFLSMGEAFSSPSSSLKNYDEPTLHAVDVSPAGSLKKPQNSRPGHRRNRSDTHIVVNIANLNHRRGSVQVPVGSSTNDEQPKFRHRRNHSDAGLCPVNLSQLRVSIDLDSPSQGDNSDCLYMPLMKTGNKENVSQNKSI